MNEFNGGYDSDAYAAWGTADGLSKALKRERENSNTLRSNYKSWKAHAQKLEQALAEQTELFSSKMEEVKAAYLELEEQAERIEKERDSALYHSEVNFKKLVAAVDAYQNLYGQYQRVLAENAQKDEEISILENALSHEDLTLIHQKYPTIVDNALKQQYQAKTASTVMDKDQLVSHINKITE
ncbi:hypothetical protein IT893_17990 [Thalassospira sp. A40-3]|uniref:hypothetical protein n=1 Tax=Thalassospira sp. A40-3 TaxID=2785908 RepID=UPI0018CE3615|nr:hypothetical protein [Thalassospira sp. A40-3]QPO11570.1 hypothetical protein IT893_17990 [Thalassospira sp. A40-3]